MNVKRVSQRRVAEAAQVSNAVVSAVLSDTPSSIRVSETTRQRVLEIADQLGYQRRFVSVNASGQPKTRRIAWLNYPIKEEEDWIESSYAAFYGRLMNSAIERLAEDKFTLVIKNHQSKDLTQWLMESGVEGVVWRRGGLDSALLQWISARFPMVGMNHGVETIDSVRVNPAESLRLAARHLYDRGHRRIAYFGNCGGGQCDRQMAYEAFLSEYSLKRYPEFLAIDDSVSKSPGLKAKTILDVWSGMGKDRPTALITGDVFALQILKRSLSAGISVPDELSVVGIDDIAACEISSPTLTSIPQPLEEVARTAVELLLARIADRDRSVRSIDINPRKVVERDSVADLNSSAGRPSTRAPGKAVDHISSEAKLVESSAS